MIALMCPSPEDSPPFRLKNKIIGDIPVICLWKERNVTNPGSLSGVETTLECRPAPLVADSAAYGRGTGLPRGVSRPDAVQPLGSRGARLARHRGDSEALMHWLIVR